MNPYYQSYQQRTPRPPTCPGCGSRIVWVQMKRKEKTGPNAGAYVQGGTMPCEVRWEYGDWQKTLITHSGIMIQKAPPEVLGREPHFGNCPAEISKRKRKPEPVADGSLDRILELVELP